MQRAIADVQGELADIPLSVLVKPASPAATALILDALGSLTIALSDSSSTRDSDPRSITDLAVLNCSALGEFALEVLSDLRTRQPSATVIAVGVSSETHASALLQRGADYALLKTHSRRYIRDVISAAGRRVHLSNSRLRIRYGDLVFDRERGRVWCAGSPVDLTPRELQLFQFLFLKAGRVVSNEALVSCAWRQDPTAPSNGLAVYIGYLRKKLALSRRTVLSTVRGHGYSLSLVEYDRERANRD